MIAAIYGSIGSGKSVVLEMLRRKGKHVASCDEIYHNVVMNSDEYIEQIEQNFPGTVVDGVIDTRLLGREVYGDKLKLNRLNSLAHPQIRACLRRILDGYSEAYVEVPLLLESGWREMFDKCVYVKSDNGLRKLRVSERDGKSAEEVDAIDAVRLSEAEAEAAADYVIVNDGTLAELADKVDAMVDAVNSK